MNMFYGKLNIKKILFLVLISFISLLKVNALKYDGCDYSTVARMKSIVNNVNISYNYYISDEVASYDVIISNLTPDIYFTDANSTVNYYYRNAKDGEIIINGYMGTGGTYIFYSANSECYGTKLGNKYYRFPIYNIYYNDPLCSDIKEFSLCQRWGNVTYSREEFEKKVYEYKNPTINPSETKITYEKGLIDVIISFYLKYYIYILGITIVVCGALIVIMRKKDKLKI